MTRLEQALKWWGNNASITSKVILREHVPARHLAVLRKAHKLQPVLTWPGEHWYRLKEDLTDAS